MAEIWLKATDRTGITSAANAIDVALAIDADEKGAEIREALRVLVVPPLRALFSIRKADRIAEVDKVSRMLTGPKGRE